MVLRSCFSHTARRTVHHIRTNIAGSRIPQNAKVASAAMNVALRETRLQQQQQSRAVCTMMSPLSTGLQSGMSHPAASTLTTSDSEEADSSLCEGLAMANDDEEGM
eukprot:TRINITY_DN1465_c0_g1::TRINITY_DN1465_c0_g1_i1::g.27294::m.27294 TRINITY_DN1465_c0_g1::TRINITY_DN1465_c0_g1_i1::g.27294  ORF type:complete len:106 (+),score=1.38 TRINITY_DN1465_c0_g1_i1:76-393(+)